MSEFYPAVAENIGIGRDAAGIIRDHLLDDLPFVLVRKIYLTERNAECRRDTHRIKPVRRPCALDEFRLPDLYERADDVVPLLLKQRGGDGAIHTSRKSNENLVSHGNSISNPRKNFPDSQTASPFRYLTKNIKYRF